MSGISVKIIFEKPASPPEFLRFQPSPVAGYEVRNGRHIATLSHEELAKDAPRTANGAPQVDAGLLQEAFKEVYARGASGTQLTSEAIDLHHRLIDEELKRAEEFRQRMATAEIA